MEFSKIKSIKRVVGGIRYDIEVEDTHNFFANGILVHNCNSRVAWSPVFGSIIIRTIKNLKTTLKYGFKRWGYEFCVGSHNRMLKTDNVDKTFYKGENKSVWHQMAEKYDLINVLQNGEEIFFETYGTPIQGTKFAYGLPAGQIDMMAFDLMRNGKYLDWDDAKNRFMEMGVPIVPELYRGLWNNNLVDKYVADKRFLHPSQKINEGIVVKPIFESNGHMGRKIVKYINPEYLLKGESEETDFAH